MNRKAWMGLGLAVAAAFGLAARAQEGEMGKKEHILLTGEDVKWVDAPSKLPAGAKMAVIDGDPKKAEIFTLRLKFPSGYKVSPHFHPVHERVAIMSGKAKIGLGEKVDASAMKMLGPGSYFSFPAKLAHYVETTEETVIQICTIGPWDLIYVNPDDDPSKKK